MNNQKKLPDFFDDQHRFVTICPVCDQNLNQSKARSIHNQNGLNLIHIKCSRCTNYVIALLLKTHQGISSVGIITDLTYNDANKFYNKKKLNSDQIIKIHQIFNNNQITNILLKR